MEDFSPSKTKTTDPTTSASKVAQEDPLHVEDHINNVIFNVANIFYIYNVTYEAYHE